MSKQVQQETLFELILAANYMDIKPLLDLTCATVASMIKVSLFRVYIILMFFTGGTGEENHQKNRITPSRVFGVQDIFCLVRFDAGHNSCRVPSKVGRFSQSIPNQSPFCYTAVM